ncbi:MAG: beta-galactosidase [Armatimonadota bacterium]
MKRMRLAAIIFGCILITAGSAAGDVTLEETTVQGQTAVVMENEFVRLRVRPTMGGRIDELTYKPTDTLLTDPRGGTVFVDRVWNYADAEFYRQWTNAVYEYETSVEDGKCSITLSAPGSIGQGRRMTFKKTFTLIAGSAAVRADYALAVGHEAMRPIPAGIWWHNQLGIPQQTTRYYVPTTGGVQSLAFGAGASGQYWWYDIARGWGAALGTDGTGVAAIVDDRRVMCFYHYLQGDVGMMEWAYRSEEIPNGGQTEATVWLVPFSGLQAVSGASERLVGVIDAPETVTAADAQKGVPITLRLTAPLSWDTSGEITWQRLPDGETHEAASFNLSVSPEAVAEHDTDITLPEPGTYSIRAKAMDADTMVADFFAEVVVEEPSAQMHIARLHEPIGDPNERFEDKIAAATAAPEDIPPSEEVVTPHVKWAKPYSEGSLKTLILNDALIERETVELAQRVDMDYLAPSISGKGRMGITGCRLDHPLTFEQAQKNITEALQEDLDVIVIGGVSGEFLTEEMAETLRSKVEGGTGLVWVNPNNIPEGLWDALAFSGFEGGSRPEAAWQQKQNHYLTTGIPFEEMPPVNISRYEPSGEVLASADRWPLLSVKEIGEGRVVCLGYCTSWQGPGSYKNGITPWIQFAPTKFRYWEYYFSLLARCMTWAAKKEASVQITAAYPEMDVFEMGREPAPAVTLGLQNSATARDLTACVTIQDAYGGRVASFEKEVAIAEDKSEISLDIGSLHAGLHLADVILKDASDRVVTWATVPVHVAAGVQIETIEVADTIFCEGDEVAASISLQRAGDAPGSIEFRASLTDALGRVIWRENGEIDTSGTPELAFEMPEPIATTATLRVELHSGGKLTSAAEAELLTMPRDFDDRTWGPYRSCVWGNPVGAYSREYLEAPAARRLKAVGIDTVSTSANWLLDGEQRSAFEAGFQIVNIGIGGSVLGHRTREGHLSYQEQKEKYLRTGDKKYLHRPWTLNAEDTHQHITEKADRVTEAIQRYRPVGYCCGDELSVTYYTRPFDYDFSPEALSAFRTWLQQEYGSLDALNAGWDSSFDAWESVMPMTAEEVADRGNYAPWADHRTFMEKSFADFFRFIDSSIEANDPGARLGISGSQAATAYGGYDWWRLTDALDFAQAYDHRNTGEMHRSFHDMLTAPWWGYGATDPGLEHQLWRRLLNDNDGGSYFSLGSLLCGDYTYSETITQGREDLAEFRGGLARLLQACDTRTTDVYMHYSHPSIHGSYITGGESIFEKNRDGWVKAIQDLGMQMKFLASAQIEDGVLTEVMPDVFVLPYSIALSDAEVAELQKYVEAGGMLIADARCGLMTEHCVTRSKAALDNLFGVERSAVDPRATRRPAEIEFAKSLGDCNPTGIELEAMSGDPSIKPTDGIALAEMDGIPVLVCNTQGMGTTVLLNIFMDSYAERRKMGVEGALRQVIAEVLKPAGVRPMVRVDSRQDDHFYIARYTDAGASYIGVLREPPETMTGGGPGSEKSQQARRDAWVTVTMPRAGHLYDLRAGEYLGHTDTDETLMAPGYCRMYSLLPYKVTDVQVTPRATTEEPGGMVAYRVKVMTEGGQPGLHVFRVAVTGPDGQMEHYGTQITTPDGSGDAGFRLALNDTPGTWTITATDVATGTTGSATFTVQQ